MEELERAYTEAKSRKINPKILVVVNKIIHIQLSKNINIL